MVWVQTQIAILPNELIDILDAPMPYLVGVRAKEITAQMGNVDESQFMNYLQGIECMEDKCVVELQTQQSSGLKIHNFETYKMTEKVEFV